LAALTENVGNLLAGSDPLPTKLWHYTTTSGLLGILSSRELWATNYRFMNDRTELVYGAGLIEEYFEEHSPDDAASRIVEDRLKNIVKGKDINPYIVSLSERNDDLVQWLVYADQCKGYSIGFDRALLARAIKAGPGWHGDYGLIRVVYDQKLQREILELFITQAVGILRTGGAAPPPDSTTVAVLNVVARLAQSLLMAFKAPEFKHECEWRVGISCTMHAEIQFQYRATVRGIAPYLKYPLADENGHDWGNPCVVSGSALDRELQEYTFARWNRTNPFKLMHQHSQVRYRP
jgi:hypothetical protein